ncbi:hypothetical protein ACUNHT_15335 [Serratia sp. IR-2025]
MIGASFEKGDIVTWVSQAGGSVREKKGEVVEIIPPNGKFSNAIRDRYPDLFKGAGVGFPRPEISYIVAVPQGKTGKAKPKHYWPRTSGLRLSQ